MIRGPRTSIDPNVKLKAEAIDKIEGEKEVLYSKCCALMREFMIDTAKGWLKSEVFILLVRPIILLPNSFDGWTQSYISNMFNVNINAI